MLWTMHSFLIVDGWRWRGCKHTARPSSFSPSCNFFIILRYFYRLNGTIPSDCINSLELLTQCTMDFLLMKLVAKKIVTLKKRECEQLFHITFFIRTWKCCSFIVLRIQLRSWNRSRKIKNGGAVTCYLITPLLKSSSGSETSFHVYGIRVQISRESKISSLSLPC